MPANLTPLYETIHILFECLTFSWFFIMPRTPTAKSWCFTWNNYPENWQEEINDAVHQFEQANLVYFCIGEETGESGTPHLQGFIQFDKAFTHPAQNLWRCHWESSRRPLKAIEYCKKGEQSHDEWRRLGTKGPSYGTNAVVHEHGSLPSKRGAQGKRTDLHALRESIKEAYEAGETYTERDAREDFPDTAARYPLFVKQSIKDYKPKIQVEEHELRPWQIELNQFLNRPADDRTIVFIVDRTGNAGKTWFSKHYRQLHDNVQLVPPGKYADMAYIVNEETRVFFIDTPREKVEYFNYYFLEKLKDRDVFSQKYYPEHKEFDHCVHVVVLMNELPDMSKLSQDRYKIIEV